MRGTLNYGNVLSIDRERERLFEWGGVKEKRRQFEGTFLVLFSKINFLGLLREGKKMS